MFQVVVQPLEGVRLRIVLSFLVFDFKVKLRETNTSSDQSATGISNIEKQMVSCMFSAHVETLTHKVHTERFNAHITTRISRLDSE